MPIDLGDKYEPFVLVKKDGVAVPAKEPVFVLRAQDVLAPAAIMYYADLVEGVTGRQRDGMRLRALAHSMTTWTPRKLPD